MGVTAKHPRPRLGHHLAHEVPRGLELIRPTLRPPGTELTLAYQAPGGA